ncbi:acyl-CoA dehydrogenase family protein [Kyrpidia tusciae]|uniref:Acyl-CoA dehydrogenase type 2 domain protein n=1 Tax=Kyrpidia tusciae (strain DSM 2912 / NBRC 15312 / T2) TaxID=562970 RepID=D5WXH6_KYRT2|nr:acyl-CoA dehydrogenase family protein [Kyrpidia tusciae]ADG05897.1 Acyl-CoA dehydrogenase type 2 domain protein [Kyrpidia tusciae DSM 2912]
MGTIRDYFAKTPLQRERLSQIGRLSDRLAVDAHVADERNQLSLAAIEALKAIHYPAFTVPREWGGLGIGLYEWVLYQERLAQGDASIALGIGWHLGIIYDLREKRSWPDAVFRQLCKEVVEKGALVNRAATERATGSPSRGGKPQTVAIRKQDGYELRGRKTFTTLAPVVDYFIVTATIEGTEEHAEFLVQRETPGVRIDPTWNMVGMRGTSSHDLVLDGVRLPAEALVYVKASRHQGTASPYLLFIPACYLGIALAAREEALKFAASYQPNTLNHPILYTPNVQQWLGQMELELSAARHYLYAVAERWDARPDDPAYLEPELGAVKTYAVQTALSVVDKAMRVVGAHGLALSHPLQRMYRDVRFGLHNPPMDDMVIHSLAQRAVKEAETAGGS